jgi:hypothetical protein
MAHEIRQVEGRSALWLALFAVAFLSFKDVLNSNRLFFLHLTCHHLMGCRWCCGRSSPNQLLGLILAVMDCDSDSLEAKLGGLTRSGATWNNCSCWTALGLDHKDTTFSLTRLVHSSSHMWVLGYLQHCGYVAPLWLLSSLVRKERHKLCLPLSKSFFYAWLTPLLLLFILVSLIGAIY